MEAYQALDNEGNAMDQPATSPAPVQEQDSIGKTALHDKNAEPDLVG